MTFRITNTEFTEYPSNVETNNYLNSVNLTTNNIIEIIEAFICQDKLVDGYGYQQSIACNLEHEIKRKLIANHNLQESTKDYSDNLNEMADIALSKDDASKKIYFEIEFRPNFEKDLMKFQIGFNNNKLGLAVLIVALDRDSINSKYTTMPEYHKVKRIIDELKPNYPLLLIGINGQHVD